MALFGVDIDGCADSNPPLFLTILQALRAAGHRVVILTGCSCEKVEPQDILDKTEYLQSLGLGDCYDQLVVFSDPTAQPKAEWLQANHADCLLDNDRGNAEAASRYCTVLLPWATRVGNKNGG